MKAKALSTLDSFLYFTMEAVKKIHEDESAKPGWTDFRKISGNFPATCRSGDLKGSLVLAVGELASAGRTAGSPVGKLYPQLVQKKQRWKSLFFVLIAIGKEIVIRMWVFFY